VVTGVTEKGPLEKAASRTELHHRKKHGGKNMTKLKFRPSSHSADVTFVAIYPDEKKAACARRNIAQQKICSSMRVGATVIVSGGSLDESEVDQLTGRLDQYGPIELESYDTYQELAISVRLPLGTTPSISALVFSGDPDRIIKTLLHLCQPPRITQGKRGTTYAFHYRGKQIYFDEDDSPEDVSGFVFDGEFLDPHKTIRVKEIRKI
jgi:hypothetical protein